MSVELRDQNELKLVKKEFIIILIITGAEEENIMAEMKIAIAEDNRQALDMLGNILESDKEIQVVGKAENGTDAYNMIVKTKPDIVFLDVVMPGMDGISVMERIKTNQDCSADTSFVMITAASSENLTADAFRMGACYYIVKPFSKEAVLDKVHRLKNYRNRASTLAGQPEGGAVYGVGGI